MEGVIIKDFFYTLYDIFCQILGLMGLGIYLSKMTMVCFPNLWGILLHRFVTPNVVMSVLG